MKKFSIVLLSAIALAACSRDEIVKSNESAIDFDLTTDVSVKTVALTTETIDAFQVWAYTQAPETDGRKAVMENITVSKDDNGAWTYSPKKFWPYDTKLDFYAITPTTLKGSGITPEHQLEVAVSAGSAVVDFAGATNSDQLGEGFNCKNYPDIVYATAMDMTKETLAGRAMMNFRHAMSQLQFKIKNVSSKELELSFAPTSLTIEGLDSKGTYTLPMAAATTSDFDIEESHGTWVTSVVEGKENIPHRIEVISEKVGSMTTQLITDAEDIHTVIPQKKDEIKINISVAIYQGEFYITTVTKQIPLEIDWKEGHRYTYTLSASELIIPDDPNDPYEITFEVSVDEFRIGLE